MKFGISAQNLLTIKSCIYRHKDIDIAILFGSRAIGNYKYNSDIDIALKGNLTMLSCATIKYDLENLPLPYSFDIVNYHKINNIALKQHIDTVGIRL